MEWALFFIWGLYLLFLIVIIIGWLRKGKFPQTKEQSFITVIVPFRSEEMNLPRLVEALSRQSYDRFEVLFMNDHSQDNSLSVLSKALEPFHLEYRILHAEQSSGKKAAIEKGISEAGGELIVTTDADCVMGPNWLEIINTTFSDENVKMISGPVALEWDGGFFQKWQALEFSSLIGTGGALVNLKLPVMSNGANLSYRKRVFNEVGGFDGISGTPSGDDELLMNKVNRKYPGSIKFISNSASVVSTRAIDRWEDFIDQRKRWASKWKVNKRPLTIGLALLIFLFNLSFVIMIVIGTMGLIPLNLLILLFGTKFILEFVLIMKVNRDLNSKVSFWTFCVSQFFYPIYALLFGLMANFGKYRWKGRSYHV